jgi:hypothetical protein
MFMYFPTNYVWSLAVVATLNNGGLIDEVDRACKPVLEASKNGDDFGTDLLYNSWEAVANRVLVSAQEDEAAGRLISAGEKYYRASLYTSQAERLQSPKWEGRNAAYQKSIDLLMKHVEIAGAPMEKVNIPYQDTSLPWLPVPRHPRGWQAHSGDHSAKRPGLYQGDDVLLRLPSDARQAWHQHPDDRPRRYR